MKILHSLGSFLNGGIETLLINVANRQVEEGSEVAIMIVTSKWTQEMVDMLDKRIRVIKIEKPEGSHNPWYLLKLLYYYKKYNADVLHLHGPAAAKLFKPKNKSERRIVTIHNETIAIPYSTTVDQYVAISQCVLDSFKKKTSHNNCTVCYNGIVVNTFAQKQVYNDRPYRIVALGRVLFRVKAQDIIVKALSQLPDNMLTSIHLDFWGEGDDLDALRNLVAELRLEDSVTLVGNVSNKYVSENLCNYDLMLCASHHEGLGITAIEAMTAGVPVLLSDAMGFVEVSENGKYGTHFKHSDVDSLTNALLNIFNNYHDVCDKAKQAVTYAKAKFSIDSYVEQIMNIYNQ